MDPVAAWAHDNWEYKLPQKLTAIIESNNKKQWKPNNMKRNDKLTGEYWWLNQLHKSVNLREKINRHFEIPATHSSSQGLYFTIRLGIRA